jgi:tetratricopeptide (TPR) repeat protein
VNGDETQRPQADETIVAVKPGFGAAARRPLARKPRSARRPLLAGAAITLLLGLSTVFIALPRWVEQRADTVSPEVPAAPPTVAVPAVPALSAQELAALQAEAESLLADLLQQRSRLESRSAANWGREAWLRYETLSRDGDDALLADEYALAVERYAAAHQAGESLFVEGERIVSTALAAGDQAIVAGNARLAAEQYELVLGTEPENEAAARGRARAERLPDVLALVQRADQLRQSRDLAEAAKLYREALAIDAEWSPARTALAEVNALLANAEFDSFLSRGFAALADEEYSDAEEHFLEALRLRPDSQSARDGLTQAEEGYRLDAIALSEARALAFERRELWHQAVERYQAALAEDPTMEFARGGLERARTRVDLDNKLENLIGNPSLLLTDSVLESARRLVEDARPLVESGPRLAAQVERLDRLVQIASTPITVALHSDGLTEVAVYRVGELGAFEATSIQVRPGTYTAVGSRDGYRDVRTTFTVLPGREIAPISIVCIEPIAAASRGRQG